MTSRYIQDCLFFGISHETKKERYIWTPRPTVRPSVRLPFCDRYQRLNRLSGFCEIWGIDCLQNLLSKHDFRGNRRIENQISVQHVNDILSVFFPFIDRYG
jgi:hypothetical protein